MGVGLGSYLSNPFNSHKMTFIEKTELLINQRGTVSAILVEDIGLKVEATFADWCYFWDEVKKIKRTPKAGTIWFESGSYAKWDKWSNNWGYFNIPPIPDYLKK